MPLKAGHHVPASKSPLKWRLAWRADKDPTLNAGLVALWFSKGGGVSDSLSPPPSGSVRAICRALQAVEITNFIASFFRQLKWQNIAAT